MSLRLSPNTTSWVSPVLLAVVEPPPPPPQLAKAATKARARKDFSLINGMRVSFGRIAKYRRGANDAFGTVQMDGIHP